jgi:hypothetical protein
MEEFLIGKGKTVVSVKELEVLVLDEADRWDPSAGVGVYLLKTLKVCLT